MFLVLEFNSVVKVSLLLLQETILPKLPVPPLDDTMQKYLNNLRPLLIEHEHEQVKKIVDKFAGDSGLGRKLQLYLLNRRENMDNWVSAIPFN